MSRLRNAHNTVRRKSARNFTHKSAQLRLDEAVTPFNNQVINALNVDAVKIELYQAMLKVGKPCTCEKIKIESDMDSNSAIIPTVNDVTEGIDIRMQDSDLFGDGPSEQIYGADVQEITGVTNPDAVLDDVYEEGTMYGSVANCGICYRTGFQPGYRTFGQQRTLLTTWDIDSIDGYAINPSDAPNTFNRSGKITKNTYVEFKVDVPAYLKSCVYSIRNNTEVLTDKLTVDNNVLTMEIIKRYAGKSMVIKVVSSQFTHVVMNFNIGVDSVLANISGGTESLDYSKFDAIDNYTVILPPTIYDVSPGDVIVVPSRRLVLRVMDREKKMTATKRLLEWSAQTRVLQKQESLRDIHKGFKLGE